jgi:predicted peptidase
MNFNSFIFPCPKFDFHKLNHIQKNLIFIPKQSKDNITQETIPCLFLHPSDLNKTKNFIISFHGNAEDIFSAKIFAESLYKKTLMNIIMVEYPGYSIYKGDPNADTILENTLIVYDFIKSKFNLDDKNIFIFGRSIGSSPAIYLASKRKPNALFVISSFTSIRAVADNLVGPLKYLLKERFISKEYITKVTCPILFVHGQSDPLIPYKETVALKDIFNRDYEMILPKEMTHNDFDLEEDIINPINSFIKKKCKVNTEENNLKNIEEDINKLKEIPEEIKKYIDANLS